MNLNTEACDNNKTSENMMNQTANKAFRLLIVDDNPGDVLLTIEAFKESKFKDNISVAVANDGETALAMLRKEQDYVDFVLPDFILLDLNMPGLSGTAVLENIKSDQSLKRIPVIIMSSSKANQDIQNSYDKHANSYIVKPATVSQYAEMVEKVESFWLDIAALPNK